MSSMKYYYELTISSSPPFHNSNTTQHTMRDVLIALFPAVVAGTILFGWRALLVVALCTACCVGKIQGRNLGPRYNKRR